MYRFFHRSFAVWIVMAICFFVCGLTVGPSVAADQINQSPVLTETWMMTTSSPEVLAKIPNIAFDPTDATLMSSLANDMIAGNAKGDAYIIYICGMATGTELTEAGVIYAYLIRFNNSTDQTAEYYTLISPDGLYLRA